jgi:hypothetical protein
LRELSLSAASSLLTAAQFKEDSHDVAGQLPGAEGDPRYLQAGVSEINHWPPRIDQHKLSRDACMVVGGGSDEG